ncbi:MAG: response regulator [Candidatus Limivivens sp.]|nr:response regulator [Candidatus Limivivens sp.]
MQVLIVDDDLATLDVIEKSVCWESLGIDRVWTAYNISRAKEILEGQDMDVIISDIEMPMGSGLELLTWYREKQLEGEFLFLTCHENFHYASSALKMHVAEYLTKPFDIETMETTLKKVIYNLEKKRQVRQKSEYGEWVMKNRRQVQISFWRRLLEGKISPEQIPGEMAGRQMGLDADGLCRLVLSRITEQDFDGREMDQSLYEFILENIHSEILCGTPENDRVICWQYGSYRMVATVCDEEPEEEILKKCGVLIESCGTYGRAAITCCVSNPCRIRELYGKFCRNRQLFTENVAYYGKAFSENQVSLHRKEAISVLELERLAQLLNEKDKSGFLNELKGKLGEKAREKSLTEQALRTVKQEINQAVYAYLAKSGVQASSFLSDELSVSMEEKASLSVIDMMRYVNYLLEKSFSYIEEVQKSATLIDEIQEYIRAHYQENIGRNEIAAAFFLAPEYLARMYKKKTGVFLKDSINEYRMERARELLGNERMRVSDVAAAVGYDNFSYFSTLFKRYTGMTPNEFRKAALAKRS